MSDGGRRSAVELRDMLHEDYLPLCDEMGWGVDVEQEAEKKSSLKYKCKKQMERG